MPTIVIATAMIETGRKRHFRTLGDFDVLFRPVLKEHYQEYFGCGRWLYNGNNFRIYQLIWPSTNGVRPWDPDAPDDYTYFIPLLCEPFSTA